jgi:hypothetical protein
VHSPLRWAETLPAPLKLQVLTSVKAAPPSAIAPTPTATARSIDEYRGQSFIGFGNDGGRVFTARYLNMRR